MNTNGKPFLIVMAGHTRCALPLEFVAEVLRPYRTTPQYGRGGVIATALIRGQRMEIIDLHIALGGDGGGNGETGSDLPPGEHPMLVHMKPGPQKSSLAATPFALQVTSVIGTRRLTQDILGPLSPRADIDASLMQVLTGSGTVSDKIWEQHVNASVHGADTR